MPMSRGTTGEASGPEAAARAGRRVSTALAFAWRLVAHHRAFLFLAFVLVALPLWAFGELAEEVVEGAPLVGDETLLRLLQATASPAADRVFLFLSKIGYAWGVIPVDVALIVALATGRRWRAAAFALVAIGGSALINLVAKHSFQRDRPALWESIAPEPTYSFPSGHAMGSATLACVLVLLAWHTRWRGPALALAVAFVIGVGLSRVYLGVHYPSDILAGWSAAIAWTMAIYIAFFRGSWHRCRPAP